MQYWLKISLLLCCFGFLKDFRPSEHFVYEFLIGPWRHISAEEINQLVYPIATYSYLAQLAIVFLITDFLRYKPLIILIGVSGIVIWALLLWTTSLLALQILEGFYGTFMAAEVAYYTYIYAKVPREYYQQVTGHARAAILIGRFLSGVIGQLLISFELMNYKDLNYITFAVAQCNTIRIMQDWLKISLLLCGFGFLKEFRPSEHFIYEYLIGPWRDITPKEVTQLVYPIATYSYVAQLIIVFLITDFLRYKPLIIANGLSGIVIWSLLLWSTSLLALQIVEGFYGTNMASEVAYFSYIYTKVPKEHYQTVTGHARAGVLTGKFLSGLIGQILISFEFMNFKDLHYITFATQILATLWAFLLPSVKESIYFHRDEDADAQVDRNKFKQAFCLLWSHFLKAYSNIHVVKWSIWWAMATCGYIQVQSYNQPLWSAIETKPDAKIYNGGVEAVLTLLGTCAALGAGSLKANWKMFGELILTICAIISGAALLIAAQTEYIWISYVCWIVFGSLYHFMITVVSSEVAKDIPEDSYGLVFGFNTLVALSLQSILMVIVVDGNVGFGLDPRSQYLVYGGYFLVIAAIYIVFGVISWCKLHSTKPNLV